MDKSIPVKIILVFIVLASVAILINLYIALGLYLIGFGLLLRLSYKHNKADLIALPFLLLLSSCLGSDTQDHQRVVCSEDFPGNDLPSRVIYEQTNKAVIPYVILADPYDGVYPLVGCYSARFDEIRGEHRNVCEEALPFESINPYSATKNAVAPYAFGDTVFVVFWGDDNPFHN